MYKSKNFGKALLFASLSFIFVSSCKKVEPDVPGPAGCQVQQFGTTYTVTYNGVHVLPYMFKKTFDASNRVATIDAYHISENGYWAQNGRFVYKGKMAYVLNNVANDTLMVLYYNAGGKVIRAEEKSGFIMPYNMHHIYDFTYDGKNRLSNVHYASMESMSTPQSGDFPVEYDNTGNCTRIGIWYFEYDYTRTAKKQFYSDLENINTRLGLRLLEYAGYFPEVTNPINVRIRSVGKSTPTSQPFQVGDLTGQQFDGEGNLTSYIYRGQPFPITYNCGGSSAN